MQAGRQRSSGWRRHAGDVLKNTGPGMVVSPLSPPVCAEGVKWVKCGVNMGPATDDDRRTDGQKEAPPN